MLLTSSTLLWAHLNILTKKRYDAIVDHYGSLDEAWTHIDDTMLQQLGCKTETIERVLHEAETLDASTISTKIDENSIRLISIEDDAYPKLLREIPDPPVFLFAKGNINALQKPSIALVGTRNMSAYGKRVAETIVTDLVAAGLVTVSGLAQGIDTEVAKQTLRNSGTTIAVLGHGLNSIYPRENTKIAHGIMENDGLLLSEYPPHVTPDRYTFPARNRIIAGLTLGTIVVEASAQSGSLITASLALEDGREVFAIPGQIFDNHFDGTHELIAKGNATLITSAQNVLQALGMISPSTQQDRSTYKPQTPEETTLWNALSSMPLSVTELKKSTQLSTQSINATLTLMELKGGTRNVGLGQWIRG